jgi:hypothetical protein
MVDQWFYGRDEIRHGPFSSKELRDLAMAGKIRPTDSVWKAGIERSIVAEKVKNLFAPAPAEEVPPADEPPPTPHAEPPPPAVQPSAALDPTEDPVSEQASPGIGGKTPMAPGAQQAPARKARATAGRGAVIVSQDGHAVQYRKKCTSCGFTDASKNRMIIRNGTTRLSYYCPKCRKLLPVEISGHL